MKKKSFKQIAAMTAVVLLVALYVITLLVAIFDSTASGVLFKVCLVCTIMIPVLCWMFIWVYGRLSGKETIADLNLMQDPKDKQKSMDNVEIETTEETKE